MKQKTRTRWRRFVSAGLMACLSFLSGRAMAQETTPRPEVLVVNKGVGGNSTRDGLARFERDVIETRPDHLILYFGMNDAGNSKKLVPLDEYVRNMQTMIDRARAAGVKTIVLVTLNPVIIDYWASRHPTHPNKTQAHFDAYDAAVRALAEKNGLPLADLRALVNERGGAAMDAGCLIRNEANSRAKDGVHLTAEGYRLMAGIFPPIFKDRIKPGQTVVCFGDSITYGSGIKGAGTACGATYPAWLWLHLNRMVGATDREAPLPPPTP
ncbi:MAG: GDSL-type esterase/lipase family protein [Planctomycetota bacterium]